MYAPLLSQLIGFRIRRPQILRAEQLVPPVSVAGPKSEKLDDGPPLEKSLRKRRQSSQTPINE